MIPEPPGSDSRLENLSKRAWAMVDGIFRTGMVTLEDGTVHELKPETIVTTVLAVAKLEPGKKARLPGTLRGLTLKETA